MEEFDPNLLILFNVRNINDRLVFFLKSYISDAVKDHIKENKLHFNSNVLHDNNEKKQKIQKNTNGESSLINLIDISEESNDEILIDLDYDDTIINIQEATYDENHKDELNGGNTMNKNDLVLENEVVFENDYRIVKKVIRDINMGTNYSKRVAEVVWKRSTNPETVIDIRLFNNDKNEYYKGISLSRDEARELLNTLSEYFEE